MAMKLSEEALFWVRLAAFAGLSEHVLSSGASVQDAEELLFGFALPGSLPLSYVCLTGGAAAELQ